MIEDDLKRTMLLVEVVAERYLPGEVVTLKINGVPRRFGVEALLDQILTLHEIVPVEKVLGISKDDWLIVVVPPASPTRQTKTEFECIGE